jgi:hypothetical protein
LRIHLLLSLVFIAAPLPGMDARASEGATAETNFVPMEEIKVPIIESDRINGTLRFKIVLEASDAAAAEQLTATMPMLRATALGAALEYARLNASALRAVDAGRLDRDLAAALGKTAPGVARVLIVEVAARPS